jgi:hypothetical protein
LRLNKGMGATSRLDCTGELKKIFLIKPSVEFFIIVFSEKHYRLQAELKHTLFAYLNLIVDLYLKLIHFFAAKVDPEQQFNKSEFTIRYG